MTVAIGIDLGTTNTVVAAVVDGVAVTLEDDQGRRLLPSVVSFDPSSTVLVGEPARERRLVDPANTIFSVKTLLGRSWDSAEVQAAKSRFPFQLVQGTKNSTMVVARDVGYALPEISAFVLRRAKAVAEAALGQAVDRAVITVPANFNDLQRASTKIAGKLAGLEVMRILNEPTAAALAYGQSIAKAEKIAVYDLGGGTFDSTLLDLTGNVFEVLATAGDTALGGDDIDRAVADKLAADIKRRLNIDPRSDPSAAARLSFLSEEMKKELSTAQQAKREISGLSGNRSVPVTMTRAELETLARPLLERTIEVTKQSIATVGYAPRDFDRVILVGGSTRMPLVARLVEQLFGKPPHLKVNPDEVVALGAAIQAHALNRKKAAHRRRSAHDQLAVMQSNAKGEQVPTQPPAADPVAAEVPKAPPLPQLGAAPPGARSEFFTFSKAAAVISFSQIPNAQPAAPAPPPPPRPDPAPAAGRTQTLQDGTLSLRRPETLDEAPARQERAAAEGAIVPERTLVMPGAPKKPPLPPRAADKAEFLELDEPADATPQKPPPTPRAIEGAPARAPVAHAAGPKPARRSVGPAALEAAPPNAREAPTDSFLGTPSPTEVPTPVLEWTPAGAPPPPPPRPASTPKMAAPTQVSRERTLIGAAPTQVSRERTLIGAAPAPVSRERTLIGAAPAPPPPPAPAIVAAPAEISVVPAPAPMNSGGIEGLVMGTDFLQGLDSGGTFGTGGPLDLQHDRFQRGSAIATSTSSPLLIDVTPLSLGVETAGGYADILIPANSPVPCEKTRTFLTASDGQTVVVIRVAQGESTRFGDNTRLGDLELSGLRRARRGEVKIAVTFELDADGILNVRARDQDTGRETTATMRLVGTTIDAEDIGAMAARQARHHVA